MRQNDLLFLPLKFKNISFNDVIKDYNIEIIYGDIGTIAHTEFHEDTWEIYIEETLHSTCKKFVLLHEIAHILLEHDENEPHLRQGEVDSELELDADAFARLNFYDNTIDYVIPEDTDEKYKLSNFDYIKYLWDDYLQFLLKEEANIEYKDANGNVLVKSPPFKNFDAYIYVDEYCQYKYHWDFRLPLSDGCCISTYFVTMGKHILYNRLEVNTVYNDEFYRDSKTLRFIKFAKNPYFSVFLG
jgi:hypothetical protein